MGKGCQVPVVGIVVGRTSSAARAALELIGAVKTKDKHLAALTRSPDVHSFPQNAGTLTPLSNPTEQSPQRIFGLFGIAPALSPKEERDAAKPDSTPPPQGTGPLANKSNPPTPDLTSAAFKKRLSQYPGVIVASVILRPNGNLIPKTLQENGVKIPPHAWSVNDFRDLNQYMTGVISRTP